jgi:hypothetical protein
MLYVVFQSLRERIKATLFGRKAESQVPHA